MTELHVRVGTAITLAVLMSVAVFMSPAAAGAVPGDILLQTIYPPVQEDVDVSVADAAYMPDGGLVFTGSLARDDGDRDMLTVRYLPGGTIAWALTYDMSWFDVSTALAVDGKGNVTVAGAVQNADKPSDSFFKSYYTDYRVIRYGPDGELLFEADGSGYDRNNMPAGAAVSPDDGAYVTGAASNPQQTHDFVYTLRYDPDGAEDWNTFEDFGEETHVAGLTVARDGSLWVGGYVRDGQFGNLAVHLVRYDPSDGKFSKQLKYDDPNFDRTAAAVTSDIAGDIIVAGTAMDEQGGNSLALKYSPGGKFLWEHSYGTGDAPTHADAVITDSMGRVYVAGGVERNIGFNDVLLYVLSPDGDLLDERVYTFDRECEPVAIVLDGRNDLTLALSSVSPDKPGEAMFVKVEGWPLERVRLTLREAAGLGANIRLHGDLMPVYVEHHRLIVLVPVVRPDSYHFVIGPGGGTPSGKYPFKPLRLHMEPLIYETQG